MFVHFYVVDCWLGNAGQEGIWKCVRSTEEVWRQKSLDVEISDGIPREGRLPRQWASSYISSY